MKYFLQNFISNANFSKGMLLLLLSPLVFCACGTSPESKGDPIIFTKGVYGNPGTLLEAGYRFDSLGINAVFVRSGSLNPDFYASAKAQNAKVYVEFATLNGQNYLKDHPEAWPINEKGEKAPAADWFLGICPTNVAFKEYRSTELKKILQEYQVDGIFLDYVYLHAQFETATPILPETCFCDHCTGLFGGHIGIDIPGSKIADRATWILANTDNEWRAWRNSILNGWVEDLGSIVKEYQPEAKLGIFHCAWFPEDFEHALYRTLGIDLAGLAERADVLSPMLFHKMSDRPTEWVGEYVAWLDKFTGAEKIGSPLIWPIVQAHNHPGDVSPEEFRQVMELGSRSPATGIMMFSDQSLLEDPRKILVMKELFLTKED